MGVECSEYSIGVAPDGFSKLIFGARIVKDDQDDLSGQLFVDAHTLPKFIIGRRDALHCDSETWVPQLIGFLVRVLG